MVSQQSQRGRRAASAPVRQTKVADEKGARRPISRVLSRPCGRGRPFLWSLRHRRLHAANPGGGLKGPWRPADRSASARPPLFGLAPGGVCRAAPVAGGAVGFCPTVSPMPGEVALSRRFVFCGTFPEVSPSPAVGRHRPSMEPGLSSDRGSLPGPRSSGHLAPRRRCARRRARSSRRAARHASARQTASMLLPSGSKTKAA